MHSDRDVTKNVYHHGDLRATLLRSAAQQIAAEGVEAVSLRALAQRAGVSHAAPAHHFGNRQGLLTDLAIEGFDLLAAELHSAAADFREVAVAYLRFVRRYPGHFGIMFRCDLLRADDAALDAARGRARAELDSGVEQLCIPVHDRPAVGLAAWSLVHGLSGLWREGALAGSDADSSDPEEMARRIFAVIAFVGEM